MVCKTVKEKKGFKERKSTVFKKAKELSTLCDTDLLLIFYEADQPNVPQIWCSKPDAANEVISRYYDGEKGAKVVGNSKETELKELIKRGDNCEFIKNLGIEELKKLSGVLEAKIESVGKRINFMREKKLLSSSNSQVTNNNAQFEDQCFDLDDVVFQGYNRHNDQVVNSVNVAVSDYYHNGNSQVTNSFNFGNFEDNGMNSGVLCEYDRMWDTGLYGQSLNLNRENAAKVEVVNSGDVADIDCLLDFHVDDDLHNLLMGFEVDDFSLDDLEF